MLVNADSPKDVAVQAQPGLVVNEKTLLTLRCSAQSHPPVTSITWMKTHGNSENIIKTETYETIVSLSDGGTYRCEATNEFGTGKSQKVVVKVKCE